MSIEETIRTIIREELETFHQGAPTTDEEASPEPTKPAKKAAKKKAAKKKPGRKPKAAPTPAPEEPETVAVPTDYEGFMGQIKSAAMSKGSEEANTAAKVAAQDWLEENYGTRKFSEIEVEDYAECLAGVLDVITAL